MCYVTIFEYSLFKFTEATTQ